MIRTVLAVVLSAALLAAAQPAVDDAAADRSEAQIRSDLESLDAAATDLARGEEVAPVGPSARRSVTVDLPHPGVGAARVRRVVVSPSNRTYRFRVAGRPTEVVQGTVPVVTESGEPLVLRGAGTHRLVLSLRRDGAERRVVARRARATGAPAPSDRRREGQRASGSTPTGLDAAAARRGRP